MLITGFPAGPLAANCYVVAPPAGGECVVIDPGQHAAQPLAELLQRLELRLAAIFVTHGHFDHVASAAAISARYSVDVYIGGGDVAMLTGQWTAMPADIRLAMTDSLRPGEDLDDLRPERLTPLAGGEHLHVAGLDIDALAVPGHTPGSTAYRLTRGQAEADAVFTGDTLFAGTIGRTDLPGGSSSSILDSIGGRLLTLPDETVVLPGHGDATTVGAERTFNQFLR